MTRNSVFGLRTRATKKSDTSWRIGHEAAQPLLRMTSRVAVVAAVLPVLLAVSAHMWQPAAAEATGLAASGAGYLAVVSLVLRASVIASRAARRSDGSGGGAT